MAPTYEKFIDAPYEALVLWWDSDTLAVYCPLCCEIECHHAQFKDGTFSWDEPMTLIALCRSTGVSFQAIFPWKRGLGWEKGWKNKRLETVGLDLSKLGIRETQQPTSMTISGLPLRTREDPLFWTARDRRDPLRNNLLHHDGSQHRDKKVNVELTGKKRDTENAPGLDTPTSLLSQRNVLGDMQLITTRRPKSNWIEILAPAATVDGISVDGPFALISSSKTLKHKTVAILDRRGSYAPVIAVSGWKDTLWGAENVINQEFWSQEVRELVEYISHQLDIHNLDRGTEGRVSSSHAEKQLMAFFVRMHCFLEDGFEEDKMSKLNMLPAYLGLREAWIGVDNPPCKNCIEFKESIEAACHVQFHFVLMNRDVGSEENDKTHNGNYTRKQTLSKRKKGLPLTPPNSGSWLSEKEVQEDDEFQDDFDSDSEFYSDSDNSPPSPCAQRHLRSLAARLQPRIKKNISRPFDKIPASSRQNFKRRLQTASEEDSDDASRYAPSSSPARNIRPGTKRSRKRLMAPASKSRDPILTPQVVERLSRTPQTQFQERAQYRRLERLSEDIAAAVSGVADSIEEDEQEHEEGRRAEDVSTDSDVPVAPRRRNKKPAPERIVIDLTGDTTDNGDGSEGSCLSS